MDPTNNPTSTTPNPDPVSGPAPASGQPAGGSAEFDSLASAGNSATEPAMPPAGPAPASGAPETPNSPVNPVVQPSGNSVQPPVNPVVRPSGLGVTDPIMMPDKPQEPDPIEEELKAPMKAAAPVPGSIGSAVSGPAGAANNEAPAPAAGENPFAGDTTKPTPSVSFNDPAGQPDGATVNNNAPVQPNAGKKPNKNTLIALIAVAAVIVVALVILLIVMLTGQSGSNANSSSGGNEVAQIEPEPQKVDWDLEPTNENDEEVEVDEDIEYDSSIACITEYADESGEQLTSTVTFDIANNQIVKTQITSQGVNANGSINNSTKTTTLVDVFGGETGSSDMTQFVDEGGTILIAEEELPGQIETALNANGNDVYACTSSM